MAIAVAFGYSLAITLHILDGMDFGGSWHPGLPS